MASESRTAVFTAIAANLAIAVAKFVAAAVTGSSAMLSEGIHSVVDTGNELLLLLGIHRSRKPPDDMHAFGHGKELYFWSLIVAILLFGLGGGMSFYEGISHIRSPHPIENPTWNYIVLAVAFAAESVSWIVSARQMKRSAHGKESLWRLFRRSKDPSVFTILGEDTAALLGLVVAFLGVFLGHSLHQPLLDGAASIVIGLILGAMGVFLAAESKGLLVGEGADPEIVTSIRAIAATDPAVVHVYRPLTMYFGPDQILLNVEVAFRPDLSAVEVTEAIERLEREIRKRHPQIRRIYIESDSLRTREEDEAHEADQAGLAE